MCQPSSSCALVDQYGVVIKRLTLSMLYQSNQRDSATLPPSFTSSLSHSCHQSAGSLPFRHRVTTPLIFSLFPLKAMPVRVSVCSKVQLPTTDGDIYRIRLGVRHVRTLTRIFIFVIWRNGHFTDMRAHTHTNHQHPNPDISLTHPSPSPWKSLPALGTTCPPQCLIPFFPHRPSPASLADKRLAVWLRSGVAQGRGRSAQKENDQTHILEAHHRLTAWMKIMRRERQCWRDLGRQHKVGVPLATNSEDEEDTHTHTHICSFHSGKAGSIQRPKQTVKGGCLVAGTPWSTYKHIHTHIHASTHIDGR